MNPREFSKLLRRTTKWVGLSLTLIFLLTCIASAWIRVSWSSSTRGEVILHHGNLFISSVDPIFQPGLNSAFSSQPQLRWRFQQDSELTAIPLIIPAAFFALSALPAWLLDRRDTNRRRRGQCINCGYDRRAQATGSPCPECGTT